MKTPPNTDGNLRETAAALAVIIMTTIMIGFLYALSGCKSVKAKSVTASAVSQTAIATDTSRSSGKTELMAVSASTGHDRELTHIHIGRDSAGRPSDITVDRSATRRQTTESAASVGTDGMATAVRREMARKEEETRIEETRPQPVKESSTAQKIIAVVFFFLFIWIIAVASGRKKE